MASVPLPKHANAKPTRPPVWPISSSSPLPAPLASKCGRTSRADGKCCKDLIEEERRLIDPDVVRDVVIGLSDGLTVPFALAAGLSSLGESRIVVLGGIAELFAGAISMGIGGFLASQAERDHYIYSKAQLSERVAQSCAGEMEREVYEVLGPVGVDEATAKGVTEVLRTAEGEAANASDEESVRLRWDGDVGVTAFLLKFGQGLEEIPTLRMYTSAFTIGMGYFVGGLIPLIPYFFIPRATVALIYSCIVTGVVLLIFGAVKSRVTGAAQRPRDYVWGAVSTLMVGGVAAAAAFAIVKSLEGGGD